jgi:hypothetical protein
VQISGTTLADIAIDMCEVNWAEYKKNPTAHPLNADFLGVSGCRTTNHPSGSTITRAVKFDVLRREYEERCLPLPTDGPASLLCEPAGIIQHEARGAEWGSGVTHTQKRFPEKCTAVVCGYCSPWPLLCPSFLPTAAAGAVGSTLAANMMAVLPNTLVYPEPAVPHELLARDLPLSPEDYSLALRVIFAAYARPAVAAAAGELSPRFPGLTERGGPQEFRPDRYYIKLQSGMSQGMHHLLAAMPTVPWTFLHRDPVEVLASLTKGAGEGGR